MPVELTNAQSVEVLTVNSYNIASFFVMINKHEIHITYDKGSLNNGVFTRISSGGITLKGNDFLEVSAYMVDPNKNLYGNLKTVLYEKLMQKLGETGVVL